MSQHWICSCPPLRLMSCCRAPSRSRIKQIKREHWESLYGSTNRSASTQTSHLFAPSTDRVRRCKTSPLSLFIYIYCSWDLFSNAAYLLSAFLRGNPGVVPHCGREEGSTEARASFLQEWRTWAGQSGTAGLPGKVTQRKEALNKSPTSEM